MNLYIVENSAPLKDRLMRLVSRRKGIQVVGCAPTAGQAADDIRRIAPEVVLLDIRLDKGTGFDVLRQIKTRGMLPVVIVLTNYAYPQYRTRALDMGADFFFDKTTEVDLMLQALDQVQRRLENNHSTGEPPADTTRLINGSALSSLFKPKAGLTAS